MTGREIDVLVVGAGPTGLALAAWLAAHGVRPRIVDHGLDRVHESRALGIQPRTLEVLADLGVTDHLVAAGQRTAQLRLHAHGRVHSVPLFDLGLADTAYPYLLFLSQAETERILAEHLAASGIAIERGVELVALTQHGEAVSATLRQRDGRQQQVSARYVIGCDGAHSTVRREAGIRFLGGPYPQAFILADTEADGIEPDSAHAFLSETGILLFFPLGTPATWRLLAMRPPADPTPPDAPVILQEVQAIADTYTGGTVRLHAPVWITNFRLHHRAATAYRAGRVFLAGDAAHIHSPVGAQGMNTGIQDAQDLAWKLAHTLHGIAGAGLLDTYQLERAPIGARVVRVTDRAFTIITSTSPLARLMRTRVAPILIPLVLAAKTARGCVFRAVSELAIHYRHSPLSEEGPNPPRRGPKAGDRLPDAPVVHNGQMTTLHATTAGSGWHLLLCGPVAAWPAAELTRLDQAQRGLLTVHHLGASDTLGGPHDPASTALRRLGLGPADSACYLLRPDGYIGYRAGGTDLTGLRAYLHRWLPPPASTPIR
jgi:2-polyprenyl-6-methoxyphenol hydroxylase-like FAD-dependent oxidoreductase